MDEPGTEINAARQPLPASCGRGQDGVQEEGRSLPPKSGSTRATGSGSPGKGGSEPQPRTRAQSGGRGGAGSAPCCWPLQLPPQDPSARRLRATASSLAPCRPHAPALPFTARARPVRSQLTLLAHTANLFFTQLSQWLPPALLILRPCAEGARR